MATQPERNYDESPAHPRTAIAEAVLADVPAHLDGDAVEGVLDASWSATDAACRNSAPLLDWEEYRAVEVA